MRKIVMLIFSVFIGLHVFSQTPFRNDAPVNPLGFKYHKKQFNYKKDVFAAGGALFNKKGQIIKNYNNKFLYKSGRLIGNSHGDSFLTDSNRNITLFTTFFGKKTTYAFNKNGLLIAEKNDYNQTIHFEYDTYGRVIKSTTHYKGKLKKEIRYTYQKKGDTLVINERIKTVSAVKKKRKYYIKGYVVKEDNLTYGSSYSYTNEFDKKGNRVVFYDSKANSSTKYYTYYRYYSDAGRAYKLTIGYYKPAYVKKTLTAFIDGKPAKDIVISNGVQKNEKVLYDGLKQIYYSVSNVNEKKLQLNDRVLVNKKLSQHIPHISYSVNGSFINYVAGENKVRKRNYQFVGPHMIDYRVEMKIGHTYIIRNYKDNRHKRIKKMELLTRDTTSVCYSRNLKNNTTFILVKGKHINYQHAKVDVLANGDAVLLMNNIPRYLLPNYKNAKQLEVYPAKYHKNAVVSKKQPTVTNKTECIKGDCINGWGTYKTANAIINGTFKNKVLDGVGYITYQDRAYYFGEYKNNQRDGVGFYGWKNGVIYVGEWKNGKQHGYGYEVNAKNEVVVAGIYKNGKLVSNYTNTYLSKTRNGNCVGNCTNGFGKYTYSNGDFYIGFFKDYKRYKLGTYSWANGSSYTGAYTINRRNGFGAYTYVDKSVFKGVFINDRISGLGKMKYAKTGDVIYGVFNNQGAKVRDY